ncbi:MAG: hypothetical protein EHM45_16740, partial [Desulfobacteraceae bacterium]
MPSTISPNPTIELWRPFGIGCPDSDFRIRASDFFFPMNIVHIHTHDTSGGAAKVAARLAQAQRTAGDRSGLLVGFKADPAEYSQAFDIEPDLSLREHCRNNGLLYYEFQGSHKLVDHPRVREADLLHLHNLHGGYFNPFSLSALSQSKPTVWTLHDMHPLTGHCAHSFACEKWKTGCGDCPDLAVEPPIRADASALLWTDKKNIYRESRLHLVAPAQWLKNKVEQSMLNRHPIDL